MRKLIYGLVALLASANLFAFGGMHSNFQMAVQAMAETTGLNWNVGDYANYKMGGGFLQGTNNMLVREKVSDGFWLEQNMDLGFMGKNKIEILIDPDTGEIKKLLVNGEKQDIPDNSGMEIISAEESSVTVPAGTFDAIHLKIKDKEDKVSQMWINPELIPVNGSAKSISPSQFGDITLELTEYGRGN